ncbi:MAG TPA: septation protein SpoVG family protein [Thermodesulfobacteriota bacterium]|nr:septation protein SpoVG family protein [Thermodesulfobacteriota bacterium]
MRHSSQSTFKFQEIPSVEVLSISPVEGRGSLRAFVNIQLGTLVINDCRIIQENGKKTWFSFPVLSYKTQFGAIQYKTLVQILDEKIKREVSRVVLEIWEKKERSKNGE